MGAEVSDVMLCGILRMPFDHGNDLHLMQLQQACREAASELERRADEISAQSAEIARLREALGEIVKFDRAEKRTCVDFDPAGCTYEVEDIDGPHAAHARAALETKG